MSDLNASIGDHETGLYIVTRQLHGTMTDGNYNKDGAISTFEITASVQPMGEQVADLPEGRSTDDYRLVITETPLHTETITHEPDMISIDGRDYRVEKVEKWDHWGETHYEVTVVKADLI